MSHIEPPCDPWRRQHIRQMHLVVPFVELLPTSGIGTVGLDPYNLLLHFILPFFIRGTIIAHQIQRIGQSLLEQIPWQFRRLAHGNSPERADRPELAGVCGFS